MQMDKSYFSRLPHSRRTAASAATAATSTGDVFSVSQQTRNSIHSQVKAKQLVEKGLAKRRQTTRFPGSLRPSNVMRNTAFPLPGLIYHSSLLSHTSQCFR